MTPPPTTDELRQLARRHQDLADTMRKQQSRSDLPLPERQRVIRMERENNLISRGLHVLARAFEP